MDQQATLYSISDIKKIDKFSGITLTEGKIIPVIFHIFCIRSVVMTSQDIQTF